MPRYMSFFCARSLACVAVLTVHAQSASPLKLSRTIPLPGVDGRIDHLAFDATGQRLFVCALGHNSVEVIDLRKGERVHSITSPGAPQGVAYIPGVDRIFVANDQGGVCRSYDGQSFQQLAQLDLKDDADNVRYDAAAAKLYVGFGNGGIAIIDPADNAQIGSIKLSAHPEAFELEKNGKRIFVNVPGSRQVAVVDREQGKVIATWKTDFAFENYPMALDETNHRLFVGCRRAATMMVLNTDSGEIVAKAAIPGDADDLFYDRKRRRIYVVCGAGKIEIFEQKNPDSYKVTASIDTASGARTGFFASELDTLFVAVPHHGLQEAAIRAYEIR
jgi:DNA-binding beta-propeller fold protein YncE